MNKTVDAIIERDREKLIASLQESIRIPSTEGAAEEGAPFGKPVAEALEHALKTAGALGLSTQNMEGYAGCIELGEGEEMLGVICHLDVVPEGTGWHHPPYGAVIEDGIMYGRGTLDDKGPAFASIYALAAIKEAGIPLKRRIRIILGTSTARRPRLPSLPMEITPWSIPKRAFCTPRLKNALKAASA